MVSLTIDDLQVSSPAGTLVIDAAEDAGIYIPRFCYHKRLSPAGACRVCLVEIEGMPKPQPSCTMLVRDDMVVRTDTPAIRKIRQDVLEFILLHHPLDCPVCDKGGECDLQDLTFSYGTRLQRYEGPRLHFLKAHRIGANIVLDQERCIECYRCVRFLDEWGEGLVFAFHQRGDHSVIETFKDRPLETAVLAGNTIDVCPVGALTSEKFRFKGRPFELRNAEAVCPHCSVGCNIIASARPTLSSFSRVTPRPHVSINDHWICDRGRYDYDWVDEGRILYPMVGRDAERKKATWDEALGALAGDIARVAADGDGGGAAVLLDSGTGCEDGYLARKLARDGLKTNAIYQSDPVGAMPGLGCTIDELAASDVVLLINADIRNTHPILWLRLNRSRTQADTQIIAFGADCQDTAKRADVVDAIETGREAALLGALAELCGGALDTERCEAQAAAVGVSPEALGRAAERLTQARRIAILGGAAGIGDLTGLHGALERLAGKLRERDDSTVHCGILPTGANTMGLRILDIAPGKDAPADVAEALLSGTVRCLYVVGGDPLGEADGDLAAAIEGLPLLIYQGTNECATSSRAHYVLPAATFSEAERSVVNLEGRLQRSTPCESPRGEALPGWRVAMLVGQSVGRGFKEQDLARVRQAIAAAVPDLGAVANLSADEWESFVRP